MFNNKKNNLNEHYINTVGL